MSLYKAITHGKEHRKPYRKAKAVDASCRNHGSCPYCERGRRYQYLKELERVKFELGELSCERL